MSVRFILPRWDRWTWTGGNRRLQAQAIPARIVGRDADGAPVDHGHGYLRRADIATGPATALSTTVASGTHAPDL